MKTEQPPKFFKHIFLVLFVLAGMSQAQTTTPFSKRYETQGINGDLTIIGNSILGPTSDTPYDGDTQNNFIDMVFVDIDNNANTVHSMLSCRVLHTDKIIV